MKTTHRGHEIEFYEADETWTCRALNIEDEPTLKSVKRKIDKWEVATRKLPGMPAIYFAGYAGNRIEEVILRTIAEDGQSVWAEKKTRSKYDSKREKLMIFNLALDTPENRRAIAEANKLAKKANELEEKAKAILKSITRLTVSELRLIAAERLDSEDAE